MRHIRITKVEEIQIAAISSLIKAAVALNEGENDD